MRKADKFKKQGRRKRTKIELRERRLKFHRERTEKLRKTK